MSTIQILLAGFGGQGVLFVGKFLAYKGLIEDRYLSWLPSYGPEMRGGTANCTVIVSDKPVACPVIDKTDVLLAMNLPRACGFYERCDARIEGLCNRAEPELVEVAPEHSVACFACPHPASKCAV